MWCGSSIVTESWYFRLLLDDEVLYSFPQYSFIVLLVPSQGGHAGSLGAVTVLVGHVVDGDHLTLGRSVSVGTGMENIKKTGDDWKKNILPSELSICLHSG